MNQLIAFLHEVPFFAVALPIGIGLFFGLTWSLFDIWRGGPGLFTSPIQLHIDTAASLFDAARKKAKGGREKAG